MKVTIKDGILTISMPIEKKLELSKSGKSLVVASSRGNVETDVKVEGKPLYIGLNAYIKAD